MNRAADDHAAIAKRLAEIQAEREKHQRERAQEQQPQELGSLSHSYTVDSWAG